MGEYFLWTNPSKRQYMDVHDEHDEYDFGFMFSIASTKGCKLTDDACALIKGPWRGDTVAYIGDYFYPSEPGGHNNQRYLEAFGSYPYEIALDEYEELRPDPAGSPHYRFAVNETRGEFIDRDAGAIKSVLELSPGHYDWSRYDPIVALYSPVYVSDDPVFGRWCFDDVRMSQEPPGTDYEDITGCFVDFGPRVMASDEEMRAVVESADFAKTLEREQPDRRGIEIVEGIEIVARLLERRRG